MVLLCMLQKYYVNGAERVASQGVNLECDNGIIHIIDTFLSMPAHSNTAYDYIQEGSFSWVQPLK